MAMFPEPLEPPRRIAAVRQLAAAFTRLLPKVDLGSVDADTVRIELGGGQARVSWEGFAYVTPDVALELVSAMRLKPQLGTFDPEPDPVGVTPPPKATLVDWCRSCGVVDGAPHTSPCTDA